MSISVYRRANVMGISIPEVKVRSEGAGAQFGVGGTWANAVAAMRLFGESMPLLAEIAELENALLRLARELRKTQRRCNALSRVFIPEYGDTIAYIASSMEENERESLVILRMIKQRLARAEGGDKEGDHD